MKLVWIFFLAVAKAFVPAVSRNQRRLQVLGVFDNLNRKEVHDFNEWIATKKPLRWPGLSRTGLEILVDHPDKVTSLHTELTVRLAVARYVLERRLKGDYDGSLYQYETFHEILPIPNAISAGDVVTISFCEPNNMWNSSLSIGRREIDQLEKVDWFFKTQIKRKLYVSGAPGCGKTCFFWMWASMLMQQGKRVLFIQYGNQQQKYQIWVIEDGAINLLTSANVAPEDIYKVVKGLLQERSQATKFDVCIFDGMRENEEACKFLMSALDARTGHAPEATISKLVFVSSVRFRICLGDEMIGTYSDVERILFDSWDKHGSEKTSSM